MKLLVGITLLSREYKANKGVLAKSISNISNDCKLLNVPVDFVFVEQSEDVFSERSDEYLYDNMQIVKTNYCSISNARNILIDHAKSNFYDYIIFHDVSIFFPKHSVKFLLENVVHGITPKLKVFFGDVEGDVGGSKDKSRRIIPFYDPYIWSYLIKVKDIHSIFDLDLGPGVDTKYKSGEDVLFLYQYFSAIGSFDVIESGSKKVYHPKRLDDYSKHLLYSKGQGALYRRVFKMRVEPYVYLCIFIFFLNAIRRVVLLKKNSIKILLNRVNGFFYE
ncbi:hypothetical protein V9J75_001873 [Vibrio fluvialis]